MLTERLLIVRVGAMGDVLHALPAVAALRAARPELRIDWVVDPRWAPLLVNAEGRGPVVSRVHLAETKLWSKAPLSVVTTRSALALRRSLRAQHYTAVVDMQRTMRAAVIGSFAGAQTFAGFRDPRERAAGWLYRQRLGRRGVHVAEQGAALLGEALGIPLEPLRGVPLPEEAWPRAQDEQVVARAATDAPPKRTVLLAPTAGWGAKQWPAERFGALARKLAEYGYEVKINAARADDPVAAAVVRASEGAAQVAPGSVAGLIAQVRHAALVVGGDSGPVHLAAAVGTPVVALFGPTDPARNGPWGAGPMEVLRHPSSTTNHRRVAGVEVGLAQIEVSEVLAAAVALLG